MDLTQISPLSYGVLRRNKAIVDGLTAPGLGLDERVVNAIAFLQLAHPDATEEDFDAVTPGSILAAAAKIYSATFARPEELAPVPQNP
jgi:hypothetical protein